MSTTLHTYHCLCTSLVLATSHDLNGLPRRAGEALDKAMILPCPALPVRLQTAWLPGGGRDATEAEAKDNVTAVPKDITMIMTLVESSPVVVRRNDGYEKRYMLDCGRCRLHVAYRLDWAQFSNGKQGRREDLLYILPGALLATNDMVESKKLALEDISFGLAMS